MAKRTCRDFEANLQQQMKHIKPERVNPFPVMMDAARHALQHQQQQQHQHLHHNNQLTAAATGSSGGQLSSRGSNLSTTKAAVTQPTAGGGAAVGSSPFTWCSHCGVGLSELQVQQCHACKAVYCGHCSVMNYDEREDRAFCLDCHQDCCNSEEAGMQLDNLTEGGGFGGSGAMACFCSPTSGHGRAVGHSTRSMHMASLSAERRGSVQRACNQAAAAAAAAEGGSAGCLAAMASIGGLVQQMGQQTPFFGTNGGGSGCGSNGDHFGSRGILAGGPGGSNGAVLGAGGTCGIGGRSLLGQWDLNAATPLCRLSSGAQQQPQVMTPAVLPFTSGYY